MKLATVNKSNINAVWKYMNYKTKTWEGVSDLNIYANDPEARLTLSDNDKADVLDSITLIWKQDERCICGFT